MGWVVPGSWCVEGGDLGRAVVACTRAARAGIAEPAECVLRTREAAPETEPFPAAEIDWQPVV